MSSYLELIQWCFYLTHLISLLSNPCKNGCTFPSSQRTKASAWFIENFSHSSLLIQPNLSVSYIILQQQYSCFLCGKSKLPLWKLIYFVPYTKLSVSYKFSQFPQQHYESMYDYYLQIISKDNEGYEVK